MPDKTLRTLLQILAFPLVGIWGLVAILLLGRSKRRENYPLWSIFACFTCFQGLIATVLFIPLIRVLPLHGGKIFFPDIPFGSASGQIIFVMYCIPWILPAFFCALWIAWRTLYRTPRSLAESFAAGGLISLLCALAVRHLALSLLYELGMSREIDGGNWQDMLWIAILGAGSTGLLALILLPRTAAQEAHHEPQ